MAASRKGFSMKHPVVMLFVIIAIVASMGLAAEVLKPLALSVLLSLALTPLAAYYEGRGLKRVPAVALTLLLVLGAFAGVGYVVSKFGVHGLTEALRAEVAEEPDIHVCTIFPYAIDTPHFERGANGIGRAAYAMPPVQSPVRSCFTASHG